jgi:hypothetical protein
MHPKFCPNPETTTFWDLLGEGTTFWYLIKANGKISNIFATKT